MKVVSRAPDVSNANAGPTSIVAGATRDIITAESRARMEEMPTDLLHELNQPLAAIANYARASALLLATDSADLSDVRAALEQIAAQATRAARIVQRLRSLSHNHMAMTGIEQ
jgi:C4-dicarboxylate-specific signal transduction histidine kinase